MGHWYTQNGDAEHFQPNGKDTTLRHARKKNLLPSVTTILQIIDKPGLNLWKQNQLMLAALTLPRLKGENVDRFLKRVPRDAFRAATIACDIGGEIHADIEKIFNGNKPKIHIDIAQHAVDKILEYTSSTIDDFTSESTVVGNGYGGMVDLHNDQFIIDWKTKDLKDKQKNHYPEMAMQLAAYDAALRNNGRRCINVFVDRTTPKVEIHEWNITDIDHAWEKFQLLVQYWQLEKNYYPQTKKELK
jgi:hypothetical protein